jgi:DNA-binding transcriptional ArsR family regulator
MTLVLNQQADPNPVSVRVAWSALFETVVAHWSMIVEAENIDSFLSYEKLTLLVEESGLSEDEINWMAENKGARWVSCVLLVDRSQARTPSAFAEYLRTGEALEVAQMSDSMCKRDDCVGCTHDEDPQVLTEGLASIFEGIAQRENLVLNELEPKLQHEAHLTRFLERRVSIEQLIETVTNGISYTAEAGVEEIVLVPSVMVRPWNLLFRFGGSQYFVYPASDEAVDADSDTPPSWMTQMFKALGDEKRLKVLRHLSTGPKTLGELAEYLGLAKSTTHHHLRSLRAAGLVLYGMNEDDENLFEFKKEVLPEALRLIGQYLELDQGEK